MRGDVATAKVRMAASIGYWRDIDDVDRLICPRERVVRMAAGQWDARGGVLVLTDKRLVFVATDSIQWAIERAPGVNVRCVCGGRFGTVTVTAGGERFTVRQVERCDGASLAEAADGRCFWSDRATA